MEGHKKKYEDDTEKYIVDDNTLFPMIMKCPKCGKEIWEGTSTCPCCGCDVNFSTEKKD